MRLPMRLGLPVFAILAVVACRADAQGKWGLQSGTVTLQSAGPLAFGPDGVLFVGDPKAAVVYAIDTQDAAAAAQTPEYRIDDLKATLSEAFGADPAEIEVQDMAANPQSGNVYISAQVASKPRLVRLTADGTAQPLNLDKVASSKVALPNPPEDKVVGEGRRRANRRMESITDLVFSGGRVMVSGMTSGPSPSGVLEFEFPFREASSGWAVEIYHGAHGRVEDSAAIRAFIPFNVGGEPSLLAGFTCTPLVQFPLSSVEREAKVRGKTVAELGNRNRPLDMILYQQDGKEYLLVANSERGTMKVSTDSIAQQEPITEPVSRGGTAGLPFEQIDALSGMIQLDKLDDTHAVAVFQADDNRLSLRTIELP